MNLQNTLSKKVKQAISQLYNTSLETVEFQATRKEFDGDITIVVFPMLRLVKGNPIEIGNAIGTYLVESISEIKSYNVVKGFLNLVLSDAYFLNFFNEVSDFSKFGIINGSQNTVMVEYSSPNTNKPLHLGHVRNILLGYSVAEILKASGKKAYKTQIINDRGIHICKSMLAWKTYGKGETPKTTGLKGDKLVGNYYVKFDQEYKKEVSQLIETGFSENEAKIKAPSLIKAQEMLRKWEAGDKEVVSLWKMMNEWVYDGFNKTYDSIGVDFDTLYYESNTYLLGKEVIKEGLEKEVFFQKKDGSIWCDLTEDGLDEKIVQRSDGTAVYMTQDIGTAIQRVKDYPDTTGMIYTVGNEQDYHFKVLFLILKKLGYQWADHLYHLSYGMVDLPSGKMKSREGTVVDADDLIYDLIDTVKHTTESLDKYKSNNETLDFDEYKKIALGALKYYILKVDPKKNILFNPEESIDLSGNTGPFIQYAYVRIQSILKKVNKHIQIDKSYHLNEKEKEVIKTIYEYPSVIIGSYNELSPALIANYLYDLVRNYNSLYQNHHILNSETKESTSVRLIISQKTSHIIESACDLLGIDLPDRM